MKIGLGIALFVVSAIGAVVLAVIGFGGMFAWDGQRVAFEKTITPGTPAKLEVPAVPGPLYVPMLVLTVSRNGLPTNGNFVDVPAHFAGKLRVVDASGREVAKVDGPFDANNNGFKLKGHSAAVDGDIVLERVIGTFRTEAPQTFSIESTLGVEEKGKVTVTNARIVVSDGLMPFSLKAPFYGSAVLSLASLAGLVVFLLGLRARKKAGRQTA